MANRFLSMIRQGGITIKYYTGGLITVKRRDGKLLTIQRFNLNQLNSEEGR